MSDKQPQEPRPVVVDEIEVHNLRSFSRLFPAFARPFTQSTDTVLMISPAIFFSNREAMLDNAFMNELDAEHDVTQKQAFAEWTRLRTELTKRGLVVHVAENNNPRCPDAVFPNNWFSVHRSSATSGTLCLYPMKCTNRREERRKGIIEHLSAHYATIVDLSFHETKSPIITATEICAPRALTDFKLDDSAQPEPSEEMSRPGLYLEGTGSLVLDRVNKVAYMALSQRTDVRVARDWSEKIGYSLHSFHTAPVRLRCDGGQDTRKDAAVYHTNVMMCVGSKFAVVCLEVVFDETERATLYEKLSVSHVVVEITRNQMDAFCGNVLELRNDCGEPFLVMSTKAYNAFTDEQKDILLQHVTELVHADVSTIEHAAGGGVRCMIAELF